MGLKSGEYNVIVIAVNCNGESKSIIEDDKTPAPSTPPTFYVNCSTISK